MQVVFELKPVALSVLVPPKTSNAGGLRGVPAGVALTA